jgi:hypothetical protein
MNVRSMIASEAHEKAELPILCQSAVAAGQWQLAISWHHPTNPRLDT